MEAGTHVGRRDYDGGMGKRAAARATVAVEALRERWRPILDRYRDQVEMSPHLEDRNTMAAMQLDIIENATSVTQVERALERLQRMFGHQESKVVETIRTDGEVEAELDRTIERLGGGGGAAGDAENVSAGEVSDD